MNRNANFFENGNNLITNLGAGYIKVGMDDRVYAVQIGSSATVALAFLQAKNLAAGSAKAAKVYRVWYRIGAPSSNNNWTMVELKDGVDVVNAAAIAALSGTASNPFTVVAELLVQNLDANNDFIAVNCANATFLMTTGDRYPQSVPINPLA